MRSASYEGGDGGFGYLGGGGEGGFGEIVVGEGGFAEQSIENVAVTFDFIPPAVQIKYCGTGK